jgi:hypothetical protein
MKKMVIELQAPFAISSNFSVSHCPSPEESGPREMGLPLLLLIMKKDFLKN